MMSSDDSGLVMEGRGSSDDPKTPDFPKKSKSAYDVIIIGAGPAGYTAGTVSYTHLTLPTICSV